MIESFLILLFRAGVFMLIAPAVMGTTRWLKARLQRRRGADIWQPYRDLIKLTRKLPNLPESASWIFLASPAVIFVCYLLLGCFVPTFFYLPKTGIDFIYIVYLLGLVKFVSALATFDVGAAFGNMSSGRQFFIHLFVEPVLMTITYAMVLTRQSSNLTNLIDPHRTQTFMDTMADPSMVSVLLSLGFVFLVECGRLPFDNPATHLELTMIERGTSLEYSGRALALIEWASAMKLTFFLSLLAGLAWPWGMATEMGITSLLLPLLLYFTKIFILLLVLAVCEILWLKLRLRRVVNPLLAALGLAVLAVVYVVATNYLSVE